MRPRKHLICATLRRRRRRVSSYISYSCMQLYSYVVAGPARGRWVFPLLPGRACTTARAHVCVIARTNHRQKSRLRRRTAPLPSPSLRRCRSPLSSVRPEKREWWGRSRLRRSSSSAHKNTTNRGRHNERCHETKPSSSSCLSTFHRRSSGSQLGRVSPLASFLPSFFVQCSERAENARNSRRGLRENMLGTRSSGEEKRQGQR